MSSRKGSQAPSARPSVTARIAALLTGEMPPPRAPATRLFTGDTT